MAVFEVGFGAEEAFSLGHIPAAGTRTWNEFIGKTSGYSYIDARGDIAGARWGRSGADDDVNSMTELHCDGRMKPAAIFAQSGMRRACGASSTPCFTAAPAGAPRWPSSMPG